MRDIKNVLNSLRNVVLDKFSDADDYVKIKIFPGLAISSKFVSSDESNLNICKNEKFTSDFILYMSSEFSSRFRNEIKSNHKNNKLPK